MTTQVMETQGISPKAAQPALALSAGTLITVVVLWLVTGEFDKAELTAAITGFVGAAVSFAVAYQAKPGNVKPK